MQNITLVGSSLSKIDQALFITMKKEEVEKSQ